MQADEGNVLSRLQADVWSANDFDVRTITAVHLKGSGGRTIRMSGVEFQS